MNNSGNTDPRTGIYLDNAATSFPKPECVYDAVNSFMRHNGAAVGRGSHAAAEAASRIVEQCRQRLSVLLDAASADRVAFTFNCTDSLNLLLRGLLRPGDRVVTTSLEHNSVLRPLTDLQQDGVDVEFVEFDSATGMVDPADIAAAVAAGPTHLVVLNHASNVCGTIQPAKEVAEIAHAADARFLLDAAQTLGHIPLSVRDIGVDFLAAAGHKGLMGPLGTGVLYVADGLEQVLRSVRSGGTGTASESLQQPITMPTLFESGNLNAPGIAGLNAAAEWILQTSVDALHAASHNLMTPLFESLAAIDGVRLHGTQSAEKNVGLLSFTVEGMDSREVATILDQSFGIQCRPGLHCAPLVHRRLQTSESGGTVRLSVGAFNTAADITAAADAVQQIAAAGI